MGREREMEREMERERERERERESCKIRTAISKNPDQSSWLIQDAESRCSERQNSTIVKRSSGDHLRSSGEEFDEDLEKRNSFMQLRFYQTYGRKP